MNKDNSVTTTSGRGNPSDHLANERTFLAWIRTGIGIMAFGFVVVKFSLFIKQLSILLGDKMVFQQKGYSLITGILLVGLGIATNIFAYLRYMQTQKELNAQEYKQSGLLITVVTLIISAIGAFLLIYLIRST